MLRFLLLIAVLFAAPFIAYTLWRIVQGHGIGEGGPDAALPVQALALTGAGLALIAVFVLAVLGEGDTARDGVYMPPRLEGGRIISGEIRPAEEPAESEPDAETPGDPPSRQR